MFGHRLFVFTLLILVSQPAATKEPASSVQAPRHWLWSRAHAIPKETTSEESGYFSIVEGKNGVVVVVCAGEAGVDVTVTLAERGVSLPSWAASIFTTERLKTPVATCPPSLWATYDFTATGLHFCAIPSASV